MFIIKNDEIPKYEPPKVFFVEVNEILKKLGPTICCSAYELQGE
jgi:hypothetical protein